MKYILIGLLVVQSCKTIVTNNNIVDAKDIHEANRLLLDVSMEDVFSPPVASRVFSYPNIAAYELYLHKYEKSIINLSFPNTISLVKPDTVNIDYSLAAFIAHSIISKKLIFSEKIIEDFSAKKKAEFLQRGISKQRYEMTHKYAEDQCKVISKWIDADKYAKVKASDQFTLKATDSSWVLTPPNFESALEPNWKNLRPIFIKTLEDFKPILHPPFSKIKGSEFYNHAMLVYEQSKKNDDSQISIAKHWDCNPNKYVNSGHNTYFRHNISPPGHWVNITANLSKAAKLDLEKTLLCYAAVTSAMFDGVISCWDTKFTDQLIRPVSYINRYIDKDWEPYIQTPPFPEYTSGHSVMSGAASTVLKNMFTNTAFIDSTEVEFDLPARNFSSVEEAAQEASMSRFYGGIHYKFGIDNGLKQGQKIGQYVFEKFNK